MPWVCGQCSIQYCDVRNGWNPVINLTLTLDSLASGSGTAKGGRLRSPGVVCVHCC